MALGSCSPTDDTVGVVITAGEPGDAATEPPSCASAGAGRTTCGPTGASTESCCASPVVPGGTFFRGYDAVTNTSADSPATVSTFRLDRYEVTLGRLRPFISAVVGGWIPAAGAGKHVHLNGGLGLSGAGSESDGGADSFELGWDPAWNSQLATPADAWSANLLLPDASTSDSESQPVLYTTWYEAYAFCIWDGGFLPSEAEWNYAAAGGGGLSGQRTYPWASPSTNDAIDCARANYLDCGANGRTVVGSTSPLGDGAFGQADLAGNVWEWNLDWSAAYVSPCVDCAELNPTTARARNGGSFHDFANDLLVSSRNSAPPETRFYDLGLRCARAP